MFTVKFYKTDVSGDSQLARIMEAALVSTCAETPEGPPSLSTTYVRLHANVHEDPFYAAVIGCDYTLCIVENANGKTVQMIRPPRVLTGNAVGNARA